MGQGQGQEPGGDGGDFTPYQPDATPDDEPPEGGAEAPFVPYGGAPQVPYGQTSGTSVGPLATTTPTKHNRLAWVVVTVVLLATCWGWIGGVGGIVGIGDLIFGDDDSDSGTSQQPAPVEQEQMFVGVDAHDLQAGQCLSGSGFVVDNDDPVTDVEAVRCSSLHDAQVLDVNVLDERKASEYNPNSSRIELHCTQVLSPAQQDLLDYDPYALLVLAQTQPPSAGDKVVCLVIHAGGDQFKGFLPAPGAEQPT